MKSGLSVRSLVVGVLLEEDASSFEFSKLATLGRGSLTEEGKLEVSHLVAQHFQDLALFNVQCLTFSADVHI